MSESPGERPLRIGRYRAFEELGRGGMGVVYRAEGPAGEPVAIKLVLADRLLNPASLTRFQRETRALARLDHPGVVKLRGADVHDGRPYLVMDLVEGESLRARLEREGPLPLHEAVELARTLAHTLEHLHQNGLLHRDVKPDNVLLEGGRPLLTDFGLVKLLDESQEKLSQTGQMLGTPGFWAPEQAQGELDRLGPHTDVYGVGATLYACLTGRPPVVAETVLELLRAGFVCQPPSTHRPGLEPALDAVCLRALDPDPLQRYPSAAELAAALEHVLDAPAPAASRRAVWALGAVGVVILGACAAALVASSRRAELVASPPSVAPSPGPDAPATPPPSADARPRSPDALPRSPNALPQPSPTSLAEFDRLLASGALEPAERARLLLERGRHRVRAGDLEGAASDYSLAVGLAPEHAEAYVARGSARAILGDRSGAEGDFARALELDPGNANALRSRANLRQHQGDSMRALDDLTQLLVLDPDDASAYLLRAQVLASLQEHARSVADYRAFVQRVPETPDDPKQRMAAHLAWAGLGLALTRLGDPTGAIDAFTRSLRLHPDDPKGLYNRAVAHSRRGELPAAIRDMSASLELEPSVPVLVQRSAHRLKLHDLTGAAADAEAAVALDPRSPQALACRAQALQSRGRLDEARAAFDASLRIAPTHTGYLGRARVLALLGERREALDDFAQGQTLGDDPYSTLWSAALSGDLTGLGEGAQRGGWPAPLARFVAGAIDEQQLLASARALEDPQTTRMRLCEAYCFAGLMAEERDDRGRARQHYEASLATGVARYFEYQWSRHRLSDGGLVRYVDQVDPPQPLRLTVTARLSVGDDAGALAALDSLEAAGIESEELSFQRAQALARTGRELDALDALDHALASGSQGEAFALRAQVRGRRHDFAGALEDLTRALELLPERRVELLLERARRWEHAGRADMAEADCLAVLEQAPHDRRAQVALANARLLRGDDASELVAPLEAAAGSGPAVEHAQLSLAWAHLLNGQPRRARSALERAVSLGSDPKRAALWLALCGDDEPARRLSGQEGWLPALADMLTSPRSIDDLLALARSATERLEQDGRRCQALCYAGLEAERSGARALAREHYQAAVDTGATPQVEYRWAARRLGDQVRPLAW